MSATRNTVHKIKSGQTLASLVVDYRLSSTAAILDSPGNANIRSTLAADGELPVDLIVQIPPNAHDVLGERMRLINELKPVLAAHFNTVRDLAESDLLPALRSDGPPFQSDEVGSVLQNLGEFSQRSIEQIGAMSMKFGELGKAMSLTHVVTREDSALAASSGHPMAGLTWAVSSNGLSAWQSLWARDLWDGKWEGRSSDAAAQLTMQYITTVRSIVVQQADRHFRESLLLQRRLQSE
jgi:hypothetical protein